MKILAVADSESKRLWDYFKKEYLEGVDLILSAGDLSPDYLSFLVTMGQAPVFYVPGNHDRRYKESPPEGCVDINGKVVEYEGIRIGGLGGSIKYGLGPYQYSQLEMNLKAFRLGLLANAKGGLDILLTHAPAEGFHEGRDFPHHGFKAFNSIIDRYHPKYHVHGHVHKEYMGDFVREDQRGDTKVFNAYEYIYFDY